LLWWVFVRPFKKEDLRGKVVVITGASSGIGEVSMHALIYFRSCSASLLFK
jgi:hypothetical protein